MRRARRQPARRAISVGRSCVANYGELADRVGRIAGALQSRFALQRRDRLVLFMSNCPEYLELLFAAWASGLVVVPVNARLHARELAYILDNTEAAAVFVTPDCAAAAATASGSSRRPVLMAGSAEYRGLLESRFVHPVATRAEDLAWIFYTSGTTGRPKGAMLSHRNLLAMALAYHADLDTLSCEDSILHAAPLSHGSGLYAIPFTMQGAGHVIPESASFDADAVRRTMQAYHHVSMFAAPTMVSRLAGVFESHTIDHIRSIVYGGASMYLADCQRALQVFGHRLIQIYGQGESPMTITALSREAHADTGHERYFERLASVGTARTGVEVRVATGEGGDGASAVLGEVLVRGDPVMLGYWRDPDSTAATLAGGWLHTGDLGVLDDDGFLTLKDRSKDLIISGGSNVYPREVEEVLMHHPDVAEIAVTGVPDAEWGEQVVAFVVSRSGRDIDPTELDAYCLEQIARFKRPRRYIQLPSLPKNSYGKVLKTELRRQHEFGHAPAGTSSANSPD